MRCSPAIKTSFTRELLDAIPAFVFLMGDDLEVLEYNANAERLVRRERREILRRRGGEVLHCVHSHDVPEGCGRGSYCKRCLLRRAVTRALMGAGNVRQRVRMQLEGAGRKPRELYILVSAARLERPGKRHVLVILEDVAALMRLQRLMPLCICCKRVRAGNQAWKDVGSYLQRDMDVLLANCYCPDCLAAQAELEQLRRRAARLTPREDQVFRLVVKGRLNKQVAGALGMAEKTVKIHRGRVMSKMEAESLADLVRAAQRLGLASEP